MGKRGKTQRNGVNKIPKKSKDDVVDEDMDDDIDACMFFLSFAEESGLSIICSENDFFFHFLIFVIFCLKFTSRGIWCRLMLMEAPTTLMKTMKFLSLILRFFFFAPKASMNWFGLWNCKIV